jgi:hypothetical protein
MVGAGDSLVTRTSFEIKRGDLHYYHYLSCEKY